MNADGESLRERERSGEIEVERQRTVTRENTREMYQSSCDVQSELHASPAEHWPSALHMVHASEVQSPFPLQLSLQSASQLSKRVGRDISTRWHVPASTPHTATARSRRSTFNEDAIAECSVAPHALSTS